MASLCLLGGNKLDRHEKRDAMLFFWTIFIKLRGKIKDPIHRRLKDATEKIMRSGRCGTKKKKKHKLMKAGR